MGTSRYSDSTIGGLQMTVSRAVEMMLESVEYLNHLYDAWNTV